jgi:hypothetical protein
MYRQPDTTTKKDGSRNVLTCLDVPERQRRFSGVCDFSA